MKTIFIIFGSILLLNISVNAEWDVVSDDLDNTGILGTFFISENIGWGCGLEGKIIKTTDGGLTWNIYESQTNNKLHDIFFINENIGWAVGGIDGHNGSTGSCIVLKTTDGGLTWSTVFNVNDYRFNTVFFISESIGFAGGGYYANSPGTIYKTTDGGISWNKSTTPPGNIFKLHFSSELIGFAVGNLEDKNLDKGYVFKTIDGGNIWSALPFYKQVKVLWDVYSINDSVAYIVGSNYLLKTHGYGEIWDDKDFPFYTLCGIKVFDKKGIIITTNGQIAEFETDSLNWNYISDSIIMNGIEKPFIYDLENFWALKNYRIVKFFKPNTIDEKNSENNGVDLISNFINDKLIIKTNFENQLKFEIFDILGNKMFDGITYSEINVSKLLHGVYFIKFENGIVKSFIKI